MYLGLVTEPRGLVANLLERPLMSVERIVHHGRDNPRAVKRAVLFGGDGRPDADHVAAHRVDVLARRQQEQLSVQQLDRVDMLKLDTGGVQGVEQGLARGDDRRRVGKRDDDLPVNLFPCWRLFVTVRHVALPRGSVLYGAGELRLADVWRDRGSRTSSISHRRPGPRCIYLRPPG